MVEVPEEPSGAKGCGAKGMGQYLCWAAGGAVDWLLHFLVSPENCPCGKMLPADGAEPVEAAVMGRRAHVRFHGLQLVMCVGG